MQLNMIKQSFEVCRDKK